MVDAWQDRSEDPNAQTVPFKNFLGLNNRLPPERLTPQELVQAINVDIDDSGGARSRQGFTSVLSGRCHSIWADGNTCLFVQNEQLMQLLPDFTPVALGLMGLDELHPLSYVMVNGTVYFTNGVITGAFQNGAVRSWGLTQPPPPQAELITGGALSACSIGYTATYLRSDGQESGAGNIGAIQVPAGSYGLQWTIQQPIDPDVTQIRVYMTGPNGSEFFLAAQVPVGTKTAVYTGDGSDLSVPMWTQFMGAPPAGSQAVMFNSRILIAQGQLLWYTEPFSFELMDQGENFLWFSSKITMVAPVAEGVFVATETETVFLEGMDIAKATRLPKTSYGAIPGTLAYTDGSLVGGGQFTSTVAMWATPQGICAGGNEGFIKGVMRNLTQAKVAMTDAPQGAGMFRQSNGINQYLSMLNTNQDSQNAFMGDDVSATVIRNGQIVST